MANKNRLVNAFQKGNHMHELARYTGRPKHFETPGQLWDAACEYFEFTMENPLCFVKYKYGTLREQCNTRPMSLTGFRLYHRLSVNSFNNYSKQPGFKETTDKIKEVIWIHNFNHAATGFLGSYKIERLYRKIFNEKL